VNEAAQISQLSGNQISQLSFEDYNLKGSMEGEFLEITSTGRNTRGSHGNQQKREGGTISAL
jgi:hypothetical protein